MIIHIVPDKDKNQHSIGNTYSCKCEPSLKKRKNEKQVIHNSFDGREFFETIDLKFDIQGMIPVNFGWSTISYERR